jgi:HEPN domain-containing protein
MDDDILDITEWILYAQEDYDGAANIAKTPNPYSSRHVCYLCQQSAEKILKAYMIAKDGSRVKEHDLEKLLRRCERYSTDFNGLTIACSRLDTHITKTRYPSGMRLTEFDMKQALKDAYQILEFTLSKLKELGYRETIFTHPLTP